jgi:hypothetical protein
MRTIGSHISLGFSIPHLCATAWLASALLSGPLLRAQKSGLAFWEPPASADAPLTHPPRRDPDRYDTLRRAFVDAHCTPDRMQEQPVGAHEDKNLICTLPGESAASILVVARYDGHAGAGFQSTWIDALFLPLLEHAAEAQPRRHTLVFAALTSEGGEAAFFTALRNSGKPLPTAMIVLDGLGWGSPLWYTVFSVNTTPGHPAELGSNAALGAIASTIARFMKVPDPLPLSPERFLTNGGFSAAEYYRSQRYESSLFRRAGPIPELLIYSDEPEQATQQGGVDLSIPDIRRDFDYVAYLLCLADLKLDPAAVPNAKPDSQPH